MSIAPRHNTIANKAAKGTVSAKHEKYNTVNVLSGHTVNPVSPLVREDSVRTHDLANELAKLHATERTKSAEEERPRRDRDNCKGPTEGASCRTELCAAPTTTATGDTGYQRDASVSSGISHHNVEGRCCGRQCRATELHCLPNVLDRLRGDPGCRQRLRIPTLQGRARRQHRQKSPSKSPAKA